MAGSGETTGNGPPRLWRASILLVLLVGPILVYIGLGALWLRERGWLLHGSLVWIGLGVLFGLLADRWTRERKPVLPPIDWEQPKTFTPRDRSAWGLVEEEAAKGDTLPLDRLSLPDTYIDNGRALARRLAALYRPGADDPLDAVPVVELLGALELAAEDLGRLCRQVPGGDLITPSMWKRAVQVSDYVSRANDLYSYILPIFQPWSGLVRLGTQRLMVKPAWRNMQQNVLRWFYRAYVNRLGMHLIELYSGRLAIGVDQYRRLTRRHAVAVASALESSETLDLAVAGSADAGVSEVRDALRAAASGDLGPARARLSAAGVEAKLADRLGSLRAGVVATYPPGDGDGEVSSRDRKALRKAVDAAADADLLVLVVDGRRGATAADAAFARDWEAWFAEHPGRERPPAVVVMTGADDPDLAGEWTPPHNWTAPRSHRENAVRARMDAVRKALPPGFPEPIAVGLGAGGAAPFGLDELVLPALAVQAAAAERVALIRRLDHYANRSKARRIFEQVGDRGRQLWNVWRSKKTADAPAS